MAPSILMRRGLRKHCPVCNQGHLFRHWVSMVECCPRCGLRFRRVPGQWLGSWFLNICVAQMAVVVVLIAALAATYPSPPRVAVALLALVTAVGVPFAFFPWSRTLWTAIDLMMGPLELDEGVAPGYELELAAASRALVGQRRRGR